MNGIVQQQALGLGSRSHGMTENVYAEVIVDTTAGELDRAFDYAIPENLNEIAIGQTVKVPFGAKTKDGIVVGLKNTTDVPAAKIKPIIKAGEAALTPEQVELAFWLRGKYHATLAACLRLMIPPSARGRARTQLTIVNAQCTINCQLSIVNCQLPTPTPAQQAAINQINAGGQFLLQGVTGSGKTEVYLRAAEHALLQNKTVLILVPEIALTPQMVGRFAARFGQKAAVLHSRLTPAQRGREWRRIRSGEAPVAIGARSAVFAPLCDIGLIVVDEEHENTYRSQYTPCYDALVIAKKRAQTHGAALVLGSATPSTESRVDAANGKTILIKLPNRIGGEMPPITIVDMRSELVAGNRSPFSRELAQALNETINKKEQAILFINRRGFAPFISCRKCGEAVKCQQCDVAMTYHLHGNVMRCHYCSASQAKPEKCPSCESLKIKTMGIGTQAVEDELKKLFPAARIARMDADTTKDRASFAEIYEKMINREIDVLIGTQMVAKGLDFPHVTLVGVLAADTTLHLPDFRSQERTFQLITQVAGRAGRAELPGRVIVQAYATTAPAIVAAAAYDDTAFYRGEIKRRQAGLFPPFGRFLRVVFFGPDAGDTQNAAQEAMEKWRAQLQKHPDWQAALVFDGLMPAPIGRIEGQYRWQLLLRAKESQLADEIEDFLAALARNAGKTELTKKNVLASLEVNPQNMI